MKIHFLSADQLTVLWTYETAFELVSRKDDAIQCKTPPSRCNRKLEKFQLSGYLPVASPVTVSSQRLQHSTFETKSVNYRYIVSIFRSFYLTGSFSILSHLV